MHPVPLGAGGGGHWTRIGLRKTDTTHTKIQIKLSLCCASERRNLNVFMFLDPTNQAETRLMVLLVIRLNQGISSHRGSDRLSCRNHREAGLGAHTSPAQPMGNHCEDRFAYTHTPPSRARFPCSGSRIPSVQTLCTTARLEKLLQPQILLRLSGDYAQVQVCSFVL